MSPFSTAKLLQSPVDATWYTKMDRDEKLDKLIDQEEMLQNKVLHVGPHSYDYSLTTENGFAQENYQGTSNT